MSNGIKIFENTMFGTLRAVERDGEIWFVAKDVCENFGNTRYRHLVADLADFEKGVSQIDTPGGKQEMVIVNEGGLYSLLFAMQPQKARGIDEQEIKRKIEKLHQFKRWVTHEVLPSIRKHGGYITGQEQMSPEELMAKALQYADSKIKAMEGRLAEQDVHIKEMKPKALFADAVSSSNSCILIGDLAKLLRQNGYEIGQNRLFEMLRQNGFLMKEGASRNLPTQKSMEMGLFEVKESTILNADGSVRVTKTPKVTGKGQVYFINKFLQRALA